MWSLTMSWQMYPMASSVDSFICSVLEGSVTLATSCGISSGHWLTGISAQAIPATHCDAELGRYVSVPRVCKTWRTETDGHEDAINTRYIDAVLMRSESLRSSWSRGERWRRWPAISAGTVSWRRGLWRSESSSPADQQQLEPPGCSPGWPTP